MLRPQRPIDMIWQSMTDSNDYAIVVEALTKRYGDLHAVNDVSFTVRKGEVFAFVGPNGAGKTTTVEIIETIRTPTSGRVSVLGMDVTKKKRDIVPRIGVLPQGFSSFDRITVRESIQYYSRLFGCKNTDVDALMNLANLKDKSDVQFKKLSGGLKQRLGIAIALVNDPEVVFLDEPTTGLDPHARRAVWDVLLGLKSRGKTVFLTTHYMEEADKLCDTIAIIDNGKIIVTGTPSDLKSAVGADSITLGFRDAETANRAETLLAEKIQTEKIQTNNEFIRLSIRDGERIMPDLLRLLDSNNLDVQSITLSRSSLDNVFLNYTGRSIREDENR